MSPTEMITSLDEVFDETVDATVESIRRYIAQ
jgi:hypothetical protein